MYTSDFLNDSSTDGWSNDSTEENYETNNEEDYYTQQHDLAYEDVKYIFRYYNIPLWLIGVPSNLIIIFLMVRMKHLSAASFLIIFLAIMDSLTLTAYLIQRQLYYHEVEQSHFSCKFYFSTGLTCAAIANWTLVLISVERYLSVCYPFLRQFLISKNFFKICTVVLSIVLAIFIFTLDATIMTVEDEYCVHHFIDQKIYEAIATLVCYALPFLFIALFTVAVVRKIKTDFKRRASITSLQMKAVLPKSGGKENGQNQITMGIQVMEKSLSQMMIAAAFLYFALNILHCICVLILLQVYGDKMSRGVIVLDYISRIIRDWNHALNLYVYLMFSKGFRTNVRMLCKSSAPSMGGRRRSSSTGPTTWSSTHDASDTISDKS